MPISPSLFPVRYRANQAPAFERNEQEESVLVPEQKVQIDTAAKYLFLFFFSFNFPLPLPHLLYV